MEESQVERCACRRDVQFGDADRGDVRHDARGRERGVR